MTRTEQFEELRPLLFSIAYRILGSVSEAEDAVQETWLRHESSPTQVKTPKAFLSAVVTRISLDVLKSARVRREAYGEPWFPEPLLTDPYQDPERSAELADSVSMATLLLMERLSPLDPPRAPPSGHRPLVHPLAAHAGRAGCRHPARRRRADRSGCLCRPGPVVLQHAATRPADLHEQPGRRPR